MPQSDALLLRHGDLERSGWAQSGTFLGHETNMAISCCFEENKLYKGMMKNENAKKRPRTGLNCGPSD